MTLDSSLIQAFADRLHHAASHRKPIVRLTKQVEFEFSDAYLIQHALIARHLAQGERVVGMKMGLTSRAKMEQMGVHDPIYGHLTDAMLATDDRLVMDHHIHPRVEPEVAFILKNDLQGPVTPAQAMLAVEGVCAALEVIDSRFEAFKFTLPDVVADNASSSRFFLGTTVRPPGDLEDLGNLGMVLEINGVAKQIGSSAAILEHPAHSLAALVNMLHKAHTSLGTNPVIPAGSIVLAGAATAAEFVQAGDLVRLRCEDLGDVHARVI